MALFDMQAWKAPGIDGFEAGFFQKFWGEIGGQICNYVRGVFLGSESIQDVNQTLIVLIPKKDHPQSFADFRPISLVIYKIVTKVITNRLEPVMTKIVLPNQTSFVPGRHITDNILLAQKVMLCILGRQIWLDGYEGRP